MSKKENLKNKKIQRKKRFNHYSKNFNNIPDYLWTNGDLAPKERDVMAIIYRVYSVMPTVKLTQDILCEALKMSRPTIITIFKKLEKLKYIHRKRIPTQKGYTYEIIPLEKNNNVSIFEWLNDFYKKLGYDFRFYTKYKIALYKNKEEFQELEKEFEGLTEDGIIQKIKAKIGKIEH